MGIEVTAEAAEVLRRSLELAKVDPASDGGVRLRAAKALGGGFEVQVELASGITGEEVLVEGRGKRLRRPDGDGALSQRSRRGGTGARADRRAPFRAVISESRDTERWTTVYPELIERVLKESSRPDSVDHGVHHWQLVAYTGAELAREIPAADPDVVFLFGLFHDSMRFNDYVDPQHGRRGGQLARRLLAESPTIDAVSLDILVEACDLHADGLLSGDPTIGTCWDSDRLNLWRVAIVPEPERLCTEAARKPERIAWAEDLQERTYRWNDICERFHSLGR